MTLRMAGYVGLLGCVAWAATAGTPPAGLGPAPDRPKADAGPGARVVEITERGFEPAQIVLDPASLPLGHDEVVTVTIRNRLGGACTIYGAQSACTLPACISVENCRKRSTFSGEFTVKCRIVAKQVGRCSANAMVFAGDKSLHRLTVSLKTEVVALKSAPVRADTGGARP